MARRAARELEGLTGKVVSWEIRIVMFNVAYDRSACVLVAHATGRPTDDEIRRFGAALKTLDEDARAGSKTPATILSVVIGSEQATAAQRRMMADLWTPLLAPLHLFALVSTSPVARGILKVVQWLNPPGLRRRESIHAVFEDAARWVESERGEQIPSLRRLHQAVVDASRPAGTAAGSG